MTFFPFLSYSILHYRLLLVNTVLIFTSRNTLPRTLPAAPLDPLPIRCVPRRTFPVLALHIHRIPSLAPAFSVRRSFFLSFSLGYIQLYPPHPEKSNGSLRFVS